MAGDQLPLTGLKAMCNVSQMCQQIWKIIKKGTEIRLESDVVSLSEM